MVWRLTSELQCVTRLANSYSRMHARATLALIDKSTEDIDQLQDHVFQYINNHGLLRSQNMVRSYKRTDRVYMIGTHCTGMGARASYPGWASGWGHSPGRERVSTEQIWIT